MRADEIFFWTATGVLIFLTALISIVSFFAIRTLRTVTKFTNKVSFVTLGPVVGAITFLLKNLNRGR